MQDQNPRSAGEVGRDIIRDMMGEAFLQRRDQKRNSFNSAIQDYSDDVCFGRIWARPGLDRKTRSILNVSMLIALNRPNQLRTHLEGAIKNGWTLDEIREVLLHAAVYCGLPAAVDGFRIAEEVMKELELLG